MRYTFIRKIAGKAGIDHAIKWTLLTQMLRMATGPVTMVLMLKYLTPELQGYLYAFGSVLAISIFLELGFSQNILQFASHEFARLQLTPDRQLQGDGLALSRLTSLARLSFKYYGIAALLLFIATILGGSWFFRTSRDVGVAWQLPWLLACISSALSLVMNPCWSLLEGCNQIAEIACFRFWATFLTFGLSVITYIWGFGLYVGPVVALIGLAISIVYLCWRWRGFFQNFLRQPTLGVISWKQEIWPFQWRIALSWMSGYFLFSAVVPIIFRLAGPVDAGKYGFTMALVNTIAAVASSWCTTKLPQYGMFVSHQDWSGLRALWRRATAQSLLVALLGSIGMIATVALLSPVFPKLEGRYAGPVIATILCGCMLAQNFISSCAYVLRAFKQEPFVWVSLIGAILTASLIWVCTSQWGITGAAVGFAISYLIGFVPTFIIFRTKQLQFMRGFSLLGWS